MPNAPHRERPQGWAEATVSAPGVDFWSITAIVEASDALAGDHETIWTRLADRLAALGAIPLHEKVYGEPSHAARFLTARERAYTRRGLDFDAPVTIVGARPCVGGSLAGLQVFAARASTDAPLHWGTVRDDGRAVGRRLETPGMRALFLAGLRGDEARRAEPPTSAELVSMFTRTRELVEREGFTFSHVARTWIYLRGLLARYAELNAARDALFRATGLVDGDADGPLPASTAIEGLDPTGAGCFLDLAVFAGRPSGAPLFRPIPSTGSQDEARRYGPLFARGGRIDLGDAAVVYVSGTASIARDGTTAHRGDARAQLRRTYEAAESVLESADAGFHDVATGVLFCKDPSVYAEWQELVAAGTLPRLPVMPVYGDVCRAELLAELEVTAFSPPGRRGTTTSSSQADPPR